MTDIDERGGSFERGSAMNKRGTVMTVPAGYILGGLSARVKPRGVSGSGR
jgi:hypothetical protein